MKKRTKKGFTLIELIVVIAILAILAAIAIPVVTGQITKAHDSANLANQRTIELAAKVYMTENDTKISDSNLATAMSEFGLTTITGSSVGFLVDPDGNVTTTATSAGSISFN